MAELAGTWLYRSFNPTFVMGNQTPRTPHPPYAYTGVEDRLIFADATLTLSTGIDPAAWNALEGTIEWRGGGLNLNGTVLPGAGDEPVGFDIVGKGRPDSTGRPGTGTDGWEYRYHGYLTPPWPTDAAHIRGVPAREAAGFIHQWPTLVGSVFRVKDHNGQPGGWRSPAGYVGSFIAVKQQPPPFTWELSGSWTYLSFHNDPEHVYRGQTYVGFAQKPQPTAQELILQEAFFRLQTPTSTTLQGRIEWEGGKGLDLTGTIRPGVGGEPSSFQMTGIGRLDGWPWEYRYYGHLTRTWPGAVDQRPALVGSIIRSNSHEVATQAPTPDRPDGGLVQAALGYVAPFIAVDAPFVAVKQEVRPSHWLNLSSTAFQHDGPIPSKYTNDGEAGVRDVSPPLAWERVPNGTQSLVLIMDDPDAPDPNAPEMVWVHWVVYNIPPDTRSLPENAARDRAWLPLHGLNDWGSSDPSDPRARYGGPNPPIGRHRYFFKLYALDIRLDLRGAPATKSQIEKAVRGHVLLNEYLIGTYQKKA